jgi:cytochrome bd-type quinol oxidase subunit 2
MDQEYPMLTDRVQSIFIDAILIIVLMFVFAALLDKFENPPDWIRIAFFFGIWTIYEPLFVSLGCTLGQYIKGIRVRNFHDPAKRIGFLRAFIRLVLKTCLGWLSFLTIHMNKEKRAVHDFGSGSVMVLASQNKSPGTPELFK